MMASILSIGTQIRAKRKSKKMSAEVLAKNSAVHANTLRALEKGVGNVELSRLLSIVDALGLDIILVPKELAGAPTGSDQHTLTAFAKKMQELNPGIYK